MKWIVNPSFAFFNSDKTGYIFNIPNNKITECTVEFIEFIRDLHKIEFTYEDFCLKIGCEKEEGKKVFKKLCDESVLISYKYKIDKFQNTMFNVKFIELASFLTMGYKEKIVFLGFPYDQSVTNRAGCKFASKGLREISRIIYDREYSLLSYNEDISDISDFIYDIGDIKGIIFDRNGPEFSFLTNIIFSLVCTSNFPIVLGGDHSISFSTINGASLKGEIGVIHIDAHDDYFEFNLNNWSHEMHHGNYLGGVANNDAVKKIYCIGIRSLTPYLISNDKVKIYPRKSIFETFQLDKNLKYYITFDVDVIDPLLIGGVGTPVPFGFSLDQIRELLIRLIQEFEIVGMDVVEFIPDKKEEILTICSLIFECVVQQIRRNQND